MCKWRRNWKGMQTRNTRDVTVDGVASESCWLKTNLRWWDRDSVLSTLFERHSLRLRLWLRLRRERTDDASVHVSLLRGTRCVVSLPFLVYVIRQINNQWWKKKWHNKKGSQLTNGMAKGVWPLTPRPRSCRYRLYCIRPLEELWGRQTRTHANMHTHVQKKK